MNTLRFALFAVVASLAVATTGCKTTCKDGVCTTTSTQGFVGSPVDKKVAWVPGTNIVVNVRGGNVRVGSQATTSITVSPGTDAASVVFRFTPINNDTAENAEKAKREMNSPDQGGNLVTSVTQAGSVVTADVSQQGTHSSGLSATVDVLVPAGFDGDVVANTETGDVSVTAVRRSVTAKTGNGDVEVTLVAPPPDVATGNISSGNGDVGLTLPAASTIAVQAVAENGTVNTTLPANWVELVAASNSKTVQPAAGAAAGSTPWQMSSGNGDVFITVN